jgi:KipI family sensor histidine kinase inhibitor
VTTPVRLYPYGDRAVLAEVAGAAEVLALRAAAAGLPGTGETVPGARTLLVPFDPAVTTAARVRAALISAAAAPADHRPPGAAVELDVRYDGADLAAVAAESGLDPAEVVRRHTAVEYTVAFCGFSPGFAYLDGLDPALYVARLAEPRTAVPAGAVAIAGGFTGVYPRASPGGWRLLGRTDADLWDLARTPPALLPPGTRVRFRAS